MQNDSQLKITVISNRPSEQALKSFQKKLYQLHRSDELKKTNCSAYNSNNTKKP